MGWRDFGNWVLLGVAVLAGLFAILYTFLAPWYRSAMGRALFSVLSSLAAGIGYFSWAVHHSPLPVSFYPVRAMLFCAMATSIGSSVILLAQAQWGGHPNRRRELNELRLENTRKDAGDGGGRSSYDGRDRVSERRE